MKKFLKKSDKGFSLVELIVVICIMAVLIGVIAPAFIKYVSKSKDSVETQNKELLERAALTVLVDPTLTEIKVNGTLVIKDGVKPPVDNIGGNFKELLEESLGRDSSGNVRYPKGTFTIKLTGSKDKGYSATVVSGEETSTTATPTPTTEASNDSNKGTD